MNVLIIGTGGRECALAKKISLSPALKQLFVTGSNPGFPADSIYIGETKSWVENAIKNDVSLVVVGPEAPLANGIADDFLAVGIPVFGPTKAAAQLESSKSYAKDFMTRFALPTASFSVHTSKQSALHSLDGPCVVKADGLAGGKGVYVCESKEQAVVAIEELFAGRFGQAGSKVVIEEKLSGPELSVIAICDGKIGLSMLPCRDHKRRFDGDQGPNTGGMGVVCPPPDVDDAMMQRIQKEIIDPAVQGMSEMGTPFCGALYAGLMLTEEGPKLLEFNVRFGDPECQPLMMMLQEDLLSLLYNAATGKLINRKLLFRDGSCCCVVVSAEGYPVSKSLDVPIRGLPSESENLCLFFSGIRREGNMLLTNGGRILSVCGYGISFEKSREITYSGVKQVDFDDMAYRTDIGL